MENLKHNKNTENHTFSKESRLVKWGPIVTFSWVLLAIIGYQMTTEKGSNHQASAALIGGKAIDSFEDFGNHNIHNGDCNLIKEYLGQDGDLHMAFELKKDCELCFKMVDSKGNIVWNSPIMKDAPGYHEIQWDPVHLNGDDLPFGNYAIAMQVDKEDVVIGEFRHNLER